ncbi:MAG: alanine--tRNA ligase [Clostridia bacterium]|nr:alanine--tRNA ligase [Clostridia bacterium]
MEKLTSKKLMRMWREFWLEHQHVEIPGASLIPEDNSVLFTTAGMQPLVPYLMGKPHPKGTRLFDIQPCLRTNDIEEVGDNRHHTMFFMMGNWSIGDYFKDEAIRWSWDFLTNPRWLGIDPNRLKVTVFEGDDNVPRDETSANIWLECGMRPDQIHYFPKKDNWWEMGTGVGPCGPDTEIFYDTGKPSCGDNCDPSCDCGKWVEIWNNVFMEFNVPTPGAPLEKLSQQNVDTGMGLERVECVLNGYASTYQNDCFADALRVLEDLSAQTFDYSKDECRDFCVICDHIRASVFLLGDERPTTPSNVGGGYILRRLIRRAVNCARKLGIHGADLTKVAEAFIDYYKDDFAGFETKREFILNELTTEVKKFEKAILSGTKEFNNITANMKENDILSGKDAFRLFDTFGFPLDITLDLCKDRGILVDKDGFDKALREHQQLSRDNSGAMFKGGVAAATSSEDEVRLARLHSATHLMLAALKQVIGDHVEQRGSNITTERIRFDFTCDHKMTPEELAKVQDIVNQAIADNVTIDCDSMSPDEAKAQGATGIFNDKYGDIVTVYTMGKYSKEICGGPHAKTTGELGTFKIQKEESSSSGVRRIKATLI